MPRNLVVTLAAVSEIFFWITKHEVLAWSKTALTTICSMTFLESNPSFQKEYYRLKEKGSWRHKKRHFCFHILKLRSNVAALKPVL